MVSNARELLPDPDTPLTTVSLPCGISHEMFFKLWVRAPRITMASFAEVNREAPETPIRPSHALGSGLDCSMSLVAGGSMKRGTAHKRFRATLPVLFRRLRAQSSNFHYTAQTTRTRGRGSLSVDTTNRATRRDSSDLNFSSGWLSGSGHQG